MDPFRWWKRRTFRKLKQKGKIKPEQFDREKLEQLGVLLMEFIDMMYNPDRITFTQMERWSISSAYEVTDTIDLILSEETDYGYLDKYYEKMNLK